MNFRPGYLEQGAPVGMVKKEVNLIADNQRVDCGGVSLLSLSSNNTTATNRTFVLNASPLVGHQLTIKFASASSTTCELADSGTCKLNGAWTPVQYDTLSLVSDGTYWIELSRGATGSASTITLADGDIFVGNGSNVATAVTLSGDVTIDNTGVASLAALSVDEAELAAGAVVNSKVDAAAAIAYSKLAALADANILVGSAANVATVVAVTGDVTISNAGVTAIGANKVTNAMLPNPAIAGLDCRRVAHAIFDPSANAGERTQAAHTLTTTLPDNAIITGMWYEVITTFTSASDAATIALHAQSADDLVAATAISTGTTWDAALPVEGVPKIETTSSWVKTTAARVITATVGVEDLTAGLMHIWVEYLVSV